MEHLDAVVSGIGHGHDLAGAEGDVEGTTKLAGILHIRAKLKSKRSRFRAERMRGRQPQHGNCSNPNSNASHYHQGAQRRNGRKWGYKQGA